MDNWKIIQANFNPLSQRTDSSLLKLNKTTYYNEQMMKYSKYGFLEQRLYNCIERPLLNSQLTQCSAKLQEQHYGNINATGSDV